MTRITLIERILRHVYGELPQDDSNITVNLVNLWMNDGIAMAAKQCYKDAVQMDSVGYVNDSFLTTFKNLPFVQYEPNTFQVTLPQLPVGIGTNDGLSSITVVDSNGQISSECLVIDYRQNSFYRNMPPIPNRILVYPESQYLYFYTTITLDSLGYTARVKLVSGGDSTNLNSVLNVPDDYVGVVFDYCAKMLLAERLVPKDDVSDGQDAPTQITK